MLVRQISHRNYYFFLCFVFFWVDENQYQITGNFSGIYLDNIHLSVFFLSQMFVCISWQSPPAMEEYDILDLSRVGKAVESEWLFWYSCIKITVLAWPMSTNTTLFQYINIFWRSHIRWTYLYHWKFSLYSLEFLELSYQDMCACLILNILKVLFMTY